MVSGRSTTSSCLAISPPLARLRFLREGVRIFLDSGLRPPARHRGKACHSATWSAHLPPWMGTYTGLPSPSLMPSQDPNIPSASLSSQWIPEACGPFCHLNPCMLALPPVLVHATGPSKLELSSAPHLGLLAPCPLVLPALRSPWGSTSYPVAMSFLCSKWFCCFPAYSC